MIPLQVNLLLFIAAAMAFALVGLSARRKHRSASDYFHNANLRKNVVSLTATTLTLGTGLVYLVSGAERNGTLMLLVPIAVCAGFFLQSSILGRLGNSVLRGQKNVLAAVSNAISEQIGSPSVFAKVTSASLVCVFVLVLAFEIFASAKVIAPLVLGVSSTTNLEMWMSIVIFSITLFYTILGGVNAVFSVDKIQVPLVVLFLPTLIVLGIPELTDVNVMFSRLAANFKVETSTVISTAIACIAAISTQLYSILNWGAVSHVAVEDQQKLLRRVGILSSVIFISWVLIGLLHPTPQGASAWSDLMSHLASYTTASGFLAYLISGVLVLGMASVLLTTTDAIMLNAIMFWYDNVMAGDSKSGMNGITELPRIRRIGAVSFGFCFIVLLLINYYQPDPFYLLLSMAGGVTVFAPMIATALYLAKDSKRLLVFSNAVVYTYFGIFLASGIIDVVLLAKKSPWVSYVAGIAFLSSCILSGILFVRSKSP